jgi:predicted transcriptional regulator
MIALGVAGFLLGAVGSIWLALIGLFIVTAARAEEKGLHVRVALTGREAGRLMSPAITIPADVSVAAAVEDFFVPYRHTAFPVAGDDGVVGLVDLEAIGRVPDGRRADISVGEIAIRDPSLLIDEHQDVAELLERPAFQRVGRAVVRSVDTELGIVSITDVNRVMRALDLAAAA